MERTTFRTKCAALRHVIHDKEGVKRYTTEVIALTMKMLGSSSGNGSKSDAAQADDPGAVPDGSIPEDDVPWCPVQ